MKGQLDITSEKLFKRANVLHRRQAMERSKGMHVSEAIYSVGKKAYIFHLPRNRPGTIESTGIENAVSTPMSTTNMNTK